MPRHRLETGGRRPPDVEDRYKSIEKALADRLQGVVQQFGGWAGGITTRHHKNTVFPNATQVQDLESWRVLMNTIMKVVP